MSELNKFEKTIADYYYQCKAEQRQLQTKLKIETEKMQARIDTLGELMFDIEMLLGKENIRPIYEHFEKIEKVQEVEHEKA